LLGRSFCYQMKANREKMKEAVMEMDRRIIRVDAPPEHAGIMTALRRAFEDAARQPCERDFADLLRRLN
jgi:hypothetical protein